MGTPVIVGKQRTWDGGRDENGHRTWKVGFLTYSNDPLDGPAKHMVTAGLPLPGAIYFLDNDLDTYAWCTGETNISPFHQPGGDTFLYYQHDFTFTTKPRGKRRDDRGQSKRCADVTIQNPLAEPARTSGGSIRYTEEAQFDRHNQPIVNTAFEPIKGPPVEFDKSRGQVIVEQNVLNLQLKLCQGMVDCVNDSPLWDLPERFWKLSEFHWERKLYGVCSFYYTRRFVFESAFRPDIDLRQHASPPFQDPTAVLSGWDRDIQDESSLVLFGEWVNIPGALGGGRTYVVKRYPGGPFPNFQNPRHYIALKDPNGAGNTRMVLSRTTRGTPLIDINDANFITVEKYDEANFLSLGIPTTL